MKKYVELLFSTMGIYQSPSLCWCSSSLFLFRLVNRVMVLINIGYFEVKSDELFPN